jgi:hypothetical protein
VTHHMEDLINVEIASKMRGLGEGGGEEERKEREKKERCQTHQTNHKKKTCCFFLVHKRVGVIT